MAARRIKKILKIKGAGVLIFLTVLISVSFFHNLNFLRARVEAIATAALEEEVDVNGDIKLGFAGWRPALVLHNVAMRELSLTARKVAVAPLLKERIFVRIVNLSRGKESLGNYNLPVRIIPDGFEILGLKGRRGGARLTGDIKYPADRFAAKLNIDGLAYEDLTGEAKGSAKLSIDVKGKGYSFEEVTATLEGAFILAGGPGEISSGAVSFWTKDLLRSLLPGGKSATKLNCAIADFRIENGIARHNALVIDTEDAVITGKGKVNLLQQSVDITFTPNPKDMALFSVATPMRVSGTVDNLTVQPVTKAVAKKIGGLLLGVVNPAMALLPLIDMGDGGKDSPCIRYLQQP